MTSPSGQQPSASRHDTQPPSLPPAHLAPPTASAPTSVPGAGKPCPHCGTHNTSVAPVCTQCGSTLPGSPQPVQQPATAQLRRRSRRLRTWFKHPLIVALITVLLTVATQAILGPPSDHAITDLLDREIVAATTHNAALLDSIYTPQATIIDSGCSSHTQGTIWPGLALIRTRYSTLPALTGLEHFEPHITWLPDNFLATTAYVTATTMGGILADNGGSAIPLGGYEHWSAARINEHWFITSFTFSLCSLS